MPCCKGQPPLSFWHTGSDVLRSLWANSKFIKKMYGQYILPQEVGMGNTVKQEDPSLPPPTDTPKLQLFTGITIYRNDPNTSRKDFPQLKIQRRNDKLGKEIGGTG